MLLIQVLGFFSYLHHKLATLNVAILSVFKNKPQRLPSDHNTYKHAVSSKVSRNESRSDKAQKHHISVIMSSYSGIFLRGTPLSEHSTVFTICWEL
jgi:hypothetical protein